MRYFVYNSSKGKWQTTHSACGKYATKWFDGPVHEFDNYNEAMDLCCSDPGFAMTSFDPRIKVTYERPASDVPVWMTPTERGFDVTDK